MDKLVKKLNQISKNAEDIKNKTTVEITELLTDKFISSNTKFHNLDELFEKSPFEIKTQDDFNNIPDIELDNYISTHTKYKNWKEMLSEATAEYVANKLFS